MTENKPQKWLFRVASKTENGGGHVSRSLVLASAFHDTDVTFSLDIDSPYKQMVIDAGFSTTTSDKELDTYDSIFLDIYTDEFENYRKKTKCLVIIEDHKDLYNNADIYIRPYAGDFTKRPNLVLDGLKYALINKKYAPTPPVKYNKNIETVSVSMGRYDSVNITQFILESLKSRQENFITNIILGGKALHLDTIKKYLKNEYNREYNLIIDQPDLLETYIKSDVLFSSGGVTVLEACAMNLPCTVLNFTKNQIPLSKHLDQKKLINYVGELQNINSDDLNVSIERIFNTNYQHELIKNMDGFIDTDGAKNIYVAIQEHQKMVNTA